MSLLILRLQLKYLQIPEHQLQGLTPHQARVQKSLEKIPVPAWYKPAAEYAKKSSDTHMWRRGETARPGWRRDSRTYPATSRPTTPSSRDNSGCSTPCMPYKTSYTRWSTNQLNHIPGRESYFTAPSPSHSSYSIKSLNSSTSHTYKQPYLGWRSQDPLNGGVSCISTPAQRLAVSTIRVRHVSSSSQARVTPSEPGRQSKNPDEKKSNNDLHDSIKKVTNAIYLPFLLWGSLSRTLSYYGAFFIVFFLIQKAPDINILVELQPASDNKLNDIFFAYFFAIFAPTSALKSIF